MEIASIDSTAIRLQEIVRLVFVLVHRDSTGDKLGSDRKTLNASSPELPIAWLAREQCMYTLFFKF